MIGQTGHLRLSGVLRDQIDVHTVVHPMTEKSDWLL